MKRNQTSMRRILARRLSDLWQIVSVPCAAATAGGPVPPPDDRPAPEPEASHTPAEAHGSISKKRLWYWVAAILIALPVGGFLVAASGIMPIKASSGHWPITAWFLNFSMGRSVSTHAAGIEVPPLDDPGLILRGAGHYHISCRPCHGSPERRQPRVPLAMIPHPTYLPPVIPEWSPEELFYIVKHGVKFTGMPAWPTQQRDDEVWAVTAFLLTMPELDEEEYWQLVSAEPTGRAAADAGTNGSSSRTEDDVRQLARRLCADCHGIDGTGRGDGAFPSLAGQHADYLTAAMRAYARGTRHSGIMEPVAAAIREDDYRRLAEFYGSTSTGTALRPRTPAEASQTEPADADLAASLERGRQIAEYGIPDEKIPACIGCHGPTAHPRNGHHPLLAGQQEWYLRQQLELFHESRRGGSEYAHLMQPIATRMKPEHIRDVAAWFASQTSPRKQPE